MAQSATTLSQQVPEPGMAALENAVVSGQVQFSPEQEEIRQYHLKKAEELGLEIEDYVARLIKDWRREEREKANLDAPSRS